MIGRRRRDREHSEARAVWLDAVRIAEHAGSLESDADPARYRRVSQVCRAAVADAFEALWARKPAAAAPAIQEARAALEEWVRFRQDQSGSARRRAPLSATAHVLVAPSLAELTLGSVRDDGFIDLGEMDDVAELPAQHALLRLARHFAAGAGCELTVDELLELDDTDLRYALEAIALHRDLWPVRSDLRWLDAARALQANAGGPDGGR